MKKFLFFLILILSLLASCSKTETNSNTNQSSVNADPVEKTRVYVNADWVKSVIDGNQPVI